MKRYICLALCFAMIVGVFCMTGWTTGDIWSPDAFDKEIQSNYSQRDELIVSNDKYELWWKAIDCSVDLIEKETGNRWGVRAQDPDVPAVNEFGVPVKVVAKACSLIAIDCVSMENNSSSTATSGYDALEYGRIVTEKIENGIRIYYYFDPVEIRVAADVVLLDDHVEITVDPKLVQEGETNKLTTVKIAPFWCYTPNDREDSYLFYPSGSGAIVSNKTDPGNESGYTYTAEVYGNDPVRPINNQPYTSKAIRIPVYGSVLKDTGTVAIIQENAEAAAITVEAGSVLNKFSGVYSEFMVRSYAENQVKNMDNQGDKHKVYTVSPTDKAMTVGFYPLTGDKANYSGMAETYKNYLKKTGQLTETVKEESPLNLTFVGGVMVDKSFLGVPYKDLVAATTISKAQEILTELQEKTDGKISAKLLGFGSTGVENGSYAGGITLHKNIGSKKELTALADYAKQSGIDLYYDFDLVRLKKASSGFSTTFDVAYSPLLKIATVYKYHAASRSYVEETGYKLLKRELLDKGSDKVLKGISKWGLGGVSLESLSQLAYSDYSAEKTDYMSKGYMARDTVAIIDKFAENYKIASADANVYAATASDIIFETPSASSQERCFLYDVPFYQMVFKGYVSMSSESINLASDPDAELLKAVEAGSGLGYTLISDYYNEYIEYQGYYFFGSKYSDIGEGIINTANELEDYYKAIAGAEIASHTVLASGLRETVYSNGVKAYVNYTDKDIETEDGKVVAAKYYVWEK